MVKVSLDKLFNRKDNLKVITELIGLVNTPVVIEDENGVIFENGTLGEDSERYDIIVQGKSIGVVRGGEKALSIANFISLLSSNEYDKKRLSQETLELYKEINIIYDISEKIATSIGIKDVSRMVIHEAMKYIEATDGFILLVDKDTEELTITAELYNRLGMELTMNLNKLERVDKAFVKNVMESKEGVIVNDTYADERINSEKCVLSSLICVPLIIKTKVIGAIVIGSEQQAIYKAQDLKLCNALAIQAGATIENARLYDVLKETFLDTVQTLSEIIEMRADPAKGHTRRVINYCLNIAKALGLSGVETVKVKLAAILHDIGNIGISDDLLRKREGLTAEEFEIIKNHPILGSEMIKRIEQLRDVAPVVRAHHERYDGAGYPDGLKGEDIPLAARIIAVADAFDEMTNQNGEYLSLYFASEAIKNNRGTQFDPQIVDVFFDIYRDKTLEEMQEYIYISNETL